MAARTPDENHRLCQQALRAGDLDLLMSLYEDDIVFVMPGGASLRGTEDLRAFFAQTLKPNPHATLKLISLVESGDLALETAQFSAGPVEPLGERIASVSRVVLRKQSDGRWLMAIDDPGYT